MIERTAEDVRRTRDWLERVADRGPNVAIELREMDVRYLITIVLNALRQSENECAHERWERVADSLKSGLRKIRRTGL